jgi:putative membrane protein
MIRHALALAALTIPAVALAAPVTTLPNVYVAKAGASDQYEIQSSRLVMTSRNNQVRDFARQMVADHTKSTADVKAAALRSGLRPKPPRLDAMGARNVAALRRTSGAARDRLYIQQQKVSHRMALQLQQSFADHGRAAPLRAVAGNIVPVVQGHLAMLNRM